MLTCYHICKVTDNNVIIWLNHIIKKCMAYEYIIRFKCHGLQPIGHKLILVH